MILNLFSFEIIFKTLSILGSSFITYGTMLLSIYYIHIMIGVEVWGDLIKADSTPNNGGVVDCSNPKLINSGFAGYVYSMITLFILKKSINFVINF